MPINLPADLVVDLRQPILGDSFNWAGKEPAAAKKSIVIHGTASEAQNEDGFTMANYHVNKNKWDGIGVHFVITKDGYQGRQGYSPGGVQIQYVGDLLTYRAGAKNQNPGRIHIEISGLFTGKTPSEAQLRATRRLIDFLMAPNNIMPSLNFYNQVTYHNALPGQNTQCPGWQYPHFGEWFRYLQGGPEPSWFSTQQPAPAPAPAPAPQPQPAPAPTPQPDPTWLSSYEGRSKAELEQDPAPLELLVVQRDDVFAVDMTGGGEPKPIPKGAEVNVAGWFKDDNTRRYARTVFSVVTGWPKQGQYYGVAEEAFKPEQTPSNPQPEPAPTPPVIEPEPLPTPTPEPQPEPQPEVPTPETPTTEIPVRVIPKEVNSAWMAIVKVLAAIAGAFIRLFKIGSKK